MRPLRRASIFVAVVAAIAPVLVAGCSYVYPPAMTISASSGQDPYFTISREDLLKKVDEAQAKSVTPNPKTSRSTVAIAATLTTIATDEIKKHLIAEHNVTVTDADNSFANQILAAQGSQQQPSDADLKDEAQLIALTRTLGAGALDSGKLDKDALMHQLYDQKKDQLQQPAQECWHVIVIAPPQDPTATQLPAPTDVELAKAQAAKARLATEPFATVADDVSAIKDQAPGGDLKCQDSSKLPKEAVAAVADLPLNTVSDPIKLSDSYAIIRVDDRKPASTPSFDSVRSQLEQAVVQQVGQKALAELQKDVLATSVVIVDPRFGVWDAKTATVNPPPGASEPTVPTSSTTTFDPSQLLSTTVPATAVPGTTPGTSPAGTAPSGTGPSGTGSSGTAAPAERSGDGSTTTTTPADGSPTPATTTTTTTAGGTRTP